QGGQSAGVAPLKLDPVGDLAPGGKPSFSGTGQPGYQVSVMDGDTVLCSAVVAADGTWSCTSEIALSAGDHTLTAVQSTPDGRISSPTTADVTVPASGPTLNQVAGGAGGTQPVLSGTGEPGYHVSVTDENGRELCSAVVAADGTWSCTSTVSLDDGPHSLSVTQTDAAGNSSPPTRQDVTVDTTPPALAVDQTDGTAISGTATPGSVITVLDAAGNPVPGCQNLIADASGRWACTPTPPVAPGTPLQVSAVSPSGNQTNMSIQPVAVRTITFDPVQNVSTAAPPVLSGTGEPGYAIQVLDGPSATLCTTTVRPDGTWACTADVALSGGDHTLSATQAGQNGTASVPVLRSLSVPAIPTTLRPIGPVVPGTMPTLSGTGEPGYHVTVTDATGQTLCEADVADDGTWTCTSTVLLDAGDYQLSVVQTDPDGNASAPSSQTVTVASTPVTLNPVDTSSGTRPVISGTGQPGAHVQVLDGSVLVCEADVAADGTWSCQPDAAFGAGTHMLSVVQTDAAGHATQSDPQQLSVPAAGVTINPLHGPVGARPTLSGTGQPGYAVTVSDGDKQVCQAEVQPDTTWTCQATDPLDAGEYQFTVQQADPDGNPVGDPQLVGILVEAGGTGPGDGATPTASPSDPSPSGSQPSSPQPSAQPDAPVAPDGAGSAATGGAPAAPASSVVACLAALAGLALLTVLVERRVRRCAVPRRAA
ncbi:MAG: Ig-like domain-containing protein, partial [Propionibacteriaceae bacterium]|nr:Ig-like domain-containing protein [Propionibacteriaceae bacterium]